jgi:hypothetical protein
MDKVAYDTRNFKPYFFPLSAEKKSNCLLFTAKGNVMIAERSAVAENLRNAVLTCASSHHTSILP